MGQTILGQSCCLLIVLLVALGGCMPSNQHVWFLGETRKTKTCKIQFPGNYAEMEIRSFAYPNWFWGDYQLSLLFTIQVRDPRILLSVNPKGVVVFVDTLKMSDKYPGPVLDTLSDHEYRLNVPLIVRTDIEELLKHGETPVCIVLDSLLTLNGEPVHIDTVRALETQTCR